MMTLLCMFVSLIALARAPKDVPNVHLQRATSWVSNPDGVLSTAGLNAADALIDSLNNATTIELTAAIVADLDGRDIDSYATELFEMWGIGKKDRDNGILIVISRDDRRAAIRTGYGMEGVINDARAGRIIRQDIAPNMKAGNADQALVSAIGSIADYISDPAAADYLHSDEHSAANEEDISEFHLYIIGVSVLSLLLLLWITVTFITTWSLPESQRYTRLERFRLATLMAIPLTLGIAVIAWLPLWLMMRRVRLRPHYCPNCNTRMKRVDEVHDNDYLTPAQDVEEKIKSVDYDVWLCPKCNETDIVPYINRSSSYSVCPRCGARANTLQANRILRQPTTRSEGLGIKQYHCVNCGYDSQKPYNIAKIVETPIIIGGGRGFGGGGGGGFSGGSFGGGLTGGGGASGGW